MTTDDRLSDAVLADLDAAERAMPAGPCENVRYTSVAIARNHLRALLREVRDRRKAPLSVGAALADPRVQRGEAVVESIDGGRVQGAVHGDAVRARLMLGGLWTDWDTADSMQAEWLTLPARIVAVEEIDDTRGPLDPGAA